MSKYSYYLEVRRDDEWIRLAYNEMPLMFGRGYLEAQRYFPGPTLDYRIMRSDGKVVDEQPGKVDVSLGMIAGFPTAEQYRQAAQRALARADEIEQRTTGKEPHRPGDWSSRGQQRVPTSTQCATRSETKSRTEL